MGKDFSRLKAEVFRVFCSAIPIGYSMFLILTDLLQFNTLSFRRESAGAHLIHDKGAFVDATEVAFLNKKRVFEVYIFCGLGAHLEPNRNTL